MWWKTGRIEALAWVLIALAAPDRAAADAADAATDPPAPCGLRLVDVPPAERACGVRCAHRAYRRFIERVVELRDPEVGRYRARLLIPGGPGGPRPPRQPLAVRPHRAGPRARPPRVRRRPSGLPAHGLQPRRRADQPPPPQERVHPGRAPGLRAAPDERVPALPEGRRPRPGRASRPLLGVQGGSPAGAYRQRLRRRGLRPPGRVPRPLLVVGPDPLRDRAVDLPHRLRHPGPVEPRRAPHGDEPRLPGARPAPRGPELPFRPTRHRRPSGPRLPRPRSPRRRQVKERRRR